MNRKEVFLAVQNYTRAAKKLEKLGLDYTVKPFSHQVYSDKLVELAKLFNRKIYLKRPRDRYYDVWTAEIWVFGVEFHVWDFKWSSLRGDINA
jgi:guanylate kinase